MAAKFGRVTPTQRAAIEKPLKQELRKVKRELNKSKKLSEGFAYDAPTTPPNYVPLSATTQAIVFLNWHRYASVVMKLVQQVGIAHRIHGAIRDYVFGMGVSRGVVINDPEIADCYESIEACLEDFWNDPRNDIELKLHTWIYEHSCLGEVCIPVKVNEDDGKVFVQSLPSLWINEVITNLYDPTDALKFSTSRGFWKNDKRKKTGGLMVWNPNENWLDVIRYDDRHWLTELNPETKQVQVVKNPETNLAELNPNEGMLAGDAFYWRSGNVLSSNRGWGDTVQVVEAIQAYDQFLYDTMNRIDMLNRVVWEVTVQGGQKDVDAWKNIPLPQMNEFLAHNSKVAFKALTPDTKIDQSVQFTRFLRENIAGSAGFPEMAMGYAGDTNVATAKEQTDVMYAKFNNRRKWWEANLKQLLRFVVERRNEAGMIRRKDGTTAKLTRKQLSAIDFQIAFQSFSAGDTDRLANALGNIANGIVLLTQTTNEGTGQPLMDFGVAQELLTNICKQFGVDTSKISLDTMTKQEGTKSIGANGKPTDAKDLVKPTPAKK